MTVTEQELDDLTYFQPAPELRPMPWGAGYVGYTIAADGAAYDPEWHRLVVFNGPADLPTIQVGTNFQLLDEAVARAFHGERHRWVPELGARLEHLVVHIDGSAENCAADNLTFELAPETVFDFYERLMQPDTLTPSGAKVYG